LASFQILVGVVHSNNLEHVDLVELRLRVAHALTEFKAHSAEAAQGFDLCVPRAYPALYDQLKLIYGQDPAGAHGTLGSTVAA
jgi:hypothetical protein